MAHAHVDDSLSREFTKENYSVFKIYGISKAANILFSENLKEFCEKNPKNIDINNL